jgi:3-dehydroquinate dehydratase-2
VLHGPNLNLLGAREPEIYGHDTLEAIDRELAKLGRDLGAAVESRQTNREGELVEWIQSAPSGFDGVLVNPGAYTHTSIAVRDAVAAAGLPAVEVHLSNPWAREGFRHTTYLEGVVAGRVAGFGKESYLLALRGLLGILEKSR